MKHTAGQIGQFLGARLRGDSGTEIKGIASLKSATPHSLAFVEGAAAESSALASLAGTLIAGPFAEEWNTSKTLLIVDQPRLAFACAAKLFSDRTQVAGVHPTAVVDPSATIGENVTISELAVVRNAAVIGEGTVIGEGCVIGEGVVIGRACRLFPRAVLYPGTKIGDRVTIHAGVVLGSDGFGYVRDQRTGQYTQFPQVGRLEIEDDVEIGANSTIDRGALDRTRIGRGTKIDNLVHIGHNVDIGEDVVIAAQTGISGSVVIENSVIIAGQVGIADGVRIESGAILGAQSGIPSKKVIRGKGIVFWGTPARPIKSYLKELAVLAKLARKE